MHNISSSGRTGRRPCSFHSSERPKLANSKNVLGVKRKASDITPDKEPDVKRQRLSNTLTSGRQDDDESHSPVADDGSAKADVGDSQQLETWSAVDRTEPHHTASALCLVNDYNSSSSNDSSH